MIDISTMSLRSVIMPMHCVQLILEEMSGYIGVLMILQPHKAQSQNVRRFSVEYVMRSLNESEIGCKEWIIDELVTL